MTAQERSESEVLRKEEAARFCGISTRTLSEWQRKRIVPFIKISHRVVLFKKADLLSALDKFKINSVG